MSKTSSKSTGPFVVNGWSIYAHPIFLDQLEELIEEVEDKKQRDPEDWKGKNCSKRLAAILKIVSELVPSDPSASAFRQGSTLGSSRKYWFRAKFFQQYRLFFRFNQSAKVIALAWVNDESTLRAYGKKTDAYATFKNMLDSGNPPDDFDQLIKEAKDSAERFDTAMKKINP